MRFSSKNVKLTDLNFKKKVIDRQSRKLKNLELPTKPEYDKLETNQL